MPFKIHPGIGVARLGNSTSEWFIGPETVDEPLPPPGGYKDLVCRVKRQAARFRVFEYAANGSLLGEVTSPDVEIRWTVTLANTKTRPIRPSPRTLTGANRSAQFDDGRFRRKGRSVVVHLGEARTDEEGRLLVLGGHGVADSLLGEWYDDTSDGSVTAVVTKNGVSEDAAPAWVVVAPPDFAPCVTPCMSLYDRILQLYVDNGWTVPIPPTLSFSRHIYPMLRGHHDVGGLQFGVGSVQPLAPPIPVGQRGGHVAGFSPIVGGNYAVIENPRTITATQQQWLVRWQASNGVTEDWFTPASPNDPVELDRGPLSHCAAFPLAPGWEAGGFVVSSASIYAEPFRFDHAAVNPGDATKGLRAPWQSDIPACTDFFWPAQRPGAVKFEGDDTKSAWMTPGPDASWATARFVHRVNDDLLAVACQGLQSPRFFAEIVRILFGVIQDGGGVTDHGPIPPWEPWVQVLASLAIEEAANHLKGSEADVIQKAARSAMLKTIDGQVRTLLAAEALRRK